MRPAQVVIDLNALCNNYHLAKQITGKKVLAILKADAYGHGAVQCAIALQNNADGFGVACIEEAIALREHGITTPILLLEGFFEANELPLINHYNLWTTIHSPWQIAAINAASLSKKLTVFLKMDSGMHRLGIQPACYLSTYQQLLASGKIEHITLMTHFARADEHDKTYTFKQIDTFNQTTLSIDAEHCLNNSAALLTNLAADSQWVRPGLMLYGVSPFDIPQKIPSQLQPVMTLQSKIISINHLPTGEPIGYGGIFVTHKPMRIGVIAMGYADGYPRDISNGTPISINGTQGQIIGRVSMDMITIDLTDHPNAQIGTPVELWGKHISVGEVAQCCHRIPYELLCSVKRVTKLYNN